MAIDPWLARIRLQHFMRIRSTEPFARDIGRVLRLFPRDSILAAGVIVQGLRETPSRVLGKFGRVAGKGCFG